MLCNKKNEPLICEKSLIIMILIMVKGAEKNRANHNSVHRIWDSGCGHTNLQYKRTHAFLPKVRLGARCRNEVWEVKNYLVFVWWFLLLWRNIMNQSNLERIRFILLKYPHHSPSSKEIRVRIKLGRSLEAQSDACQWPYQRSLDGKWLQGIYQAGNKILMGKYWKGNALRTQTPDPR